MDAEIPSAIDCRRLLAEGGHLSGTIAPARLPRITGTLRVAGITQARIRVQREEGGRVTLSGSFSAPLEAQCQRCLEWMPLELSGEFDVRVLEPGHGAEPDDDFIYSVDGRVGVVELIEDEVLLASPMIPLHAALDCRGEPLPEAEATATTQHKPFAALAEMVRGSRNSQ